MSIWKILAAHYADGRPICNCGQAYYTPCGKGWDGKAWRDDMLVCRYGCEVNRSIAHEEIAERMYAELQPNWPEDERQQLWQKIYAQQALMCDGNLTAHQRLREVAVLKDLLAQLEKLTGEKGQSGNESGGTC